PVEPLEEHRAGGDRCIRSKPQSSHRVRKLTGRVRHVVGAFVERALELEHAQPIRLAAELARQEPGRLGPHRRQPARCRRTYPDAVTELDLCTARDADERSNGAVRMSFAEERLLELREGTVE